MRIELENHGPDEATLHVLPTLWFRNWWSWGDELTRPRIEGDGSALLVGEHRLARVQRQVEILAAAVCRLDPATGQPGDEVSGAGRLPPDRAGMQYRDRGNLATHDKPLQAAADYLNLRQLRHRWEPWVSARRRPGRAR